MSDDHKPVVHQEKPSLETSPKAVEKTQTILQQSKTKLEATSGFLPPPGMLEEYEKISPGITTRFFDMAEREIAMEELALKSEIQINTALAQSYIKADQTSRVMAGVLFGFFGVLAFVLALLGNNVGAGILLSAAVVSGIKALLPSTTKTESPTPSEGQKKLPPPSDKT